MFSLLETTIQQNKTKIQQCIKSCIEEVKYMDVINVSKLIEEFTNRKPMEIVVDTKEYLYNVYGTDQEKIDYFENEVYNESFCFIILKDEIDDTVIINTKYAELLEECCIDYMKKYNIHTLINGDIIVDNSFDDSFTYAYKYNKFVYFNKKIHDLYTEVREWGTVPPEICYPHFELNYPESMDMNCSQWIDCEFKDFREQLIKNLCFKSIKMKKGKKNSKVIDVLICSTKIVHKKENKEIEEIYFDINPVNFEIIEDIYWNCDGHISEEYQKQMITYCTNYFELVDKLCFGYASEQADSLFDKYNNIVDNKITYYGFIGGVKGEKYIPLGK